MDIFLSYQENISSATIEFYYELDKNCLGLNSLICKLAFFLVNTSVMAKYSGSQPGTIESNRKPRGLPRIIRNSDSIKPNEDSFGRSLRSIRGMKRLHS